MNILFLGNCQVNAMRGLSREMFPTLRADFQTITPYWGVFDEPLTRQKIAEADIVVSQAITNPGTTFNVADVRAAAGVKAVFVPYVYLDGVASLEIIASKGRSVIKGAVQLLRGQEGRNPVKIFEDYCTGRIDMENDARVQSSIAKIRKKEQETCDIVIADYIAETLTRQPTVYGINHPTQHVVFEVFARLCKHLDWAYDPAHKDDPVVWGRRALPASQRALTPSDARVLGLSYGCDTHWYGQGHKLMQLALKERDLAARAAAA